MAQRHHSAMRHVGPARVELGTRTIFNLLGPLSNPAKVKRQLIGVFSPQWLEPLAAVLRDLGHERARVVHGAGGMYEVRTLTPTQVAALKDGATSTSEVNSAEAGLRTGQQMDLDGRESEPNGSALRGVATEGRGVGERGGES